MYMYMEVNYGNKSDGMKKIEKQKYSKCDEFIMMQSFPSPRLIASPRLKNPVCPTIYPYLGGE